MARKLLKDTCQLAADILDGKHDAELDWIIQSAQARMKSMFRPGMTVKLHGTKNPTLDGQTGTVIKVNPKRVTVGVGEAKHTEWGTIYGLGEFNVPPSMLEVVPT